MHAHHLCDPHCSSKGLLGSQSDVDASKDGVLMDSYDSLRQPLTLQPPKTVAAEES